MIFRSLLRIRLRLKLALTACFAAALTLAMAPAQAEEPVLNLYSARHYATDEALYANFTQARASASTGWMRMTLASWRD